MSDYEDEEYGATRCPVCETDFETRFHEVSGYATDPCPSCGTIVASWTIEGEFDDAHDESDDVVIHA
jgi:Zn-finger nucleic acid-binding protein